ncbi:unnamed protein product [Lota lota]
MNGAVVKKTQDTLGKVIKKPPLTDKLLGKPPFRYLHDIFSEVIRTTGFMKGLYVENEMKSDNVKEKDSKIAFLQKAIDVVMLVSGESLAVKPARIVAGHEPERTNELLQAIAKCCLSKMSSEDAVKRVLAGEKVDPKSKASTSSSRSQDKENREGRERQPEREEKREILERSGSQEQKDPEQPKEPEVRQDTRERQRTRERRGKERDKEKEKEKEKEPQKEKEKDRERDKEKERHREKDRGREKDREKDREREKDPERAKDRDKTRDRNSHREKERDRQRERERPKEGEEKGKALDKGDRKSKVPEDPKQKSYPEETSRSAKAAPVSDLGTTSESLARIPRPSSAKGQRRRPKVTGQEGEAAAAAERAGAPQENGDASDPPANTTPSTRQIPRPSSARPAPPRVKRQESHPDVPPPERLASAKPPAAVIMEGKKQSEDEEDEDEQFLVEEAGLLPPEMPDLEVANAVELNGDEKHGGLVKKILETKKDYESSPSSPKSKEQSLVSDAAQRKARDLVGREMERLRGSVQTVCRSALPLGKIMDYIQEDMDSMQAELLAWRRENQQHADALQEEQRTTDRSVEPLQNELVELDQLIRDQQDKICAVKSNILRNEEKIHKMVTSISFSSRT